MSKSAAEIIALKAKKDFPGFCKRFLKIKTKRDGVKPFVLNQPQLLIWNQLKKMLDDGVPIRLVVLKARQYGISTFVQAFLLWLVITKQGQNALVIGQNLDMAGELFGKAELMYDLMPDWYKPKRDSKTRGKRLAFAAPNHGLLYVDTAENRDAGRSGTFQHVHCTEIPFWPDAKRTMDGLLQSVPMDPGTTVIIESTAHGVGDYFHTLWKQAEEGDSSFYPLFIPWFIHEEYEREPFKDERLPDWIRELGKKHGLSKAKLCFYHDKYQDFNCDLHTLQQEYPSSAEEAFRSSGLQFFDQRSVDHCRDKHETKPKRKGMYARRNDRPVWIEDESGKLWVWEEPQSGAHYSIGIDIATGRAGDYSAIQVLQSMRQVAAYRGKLSPDELAELCSWIGKVYNNALLIPERNGVGLSTVLKLINDLHYSNVYTFQRLDTTTGSISTDYGFTTTGKSRSAILEEVATRIRRGELEIRDERTLSEMESFVFSDDTGKKAQAAAGSNDDMVMALALAVHGSGYFMGGPVEAEYDPQSF